MNSRTKLRIIFHITHHFNVKRVKRTRKDVRCKREDVRCKMSDVRGKREEGRGKKDEGIFGRN